MAKAFLRVKAELTLDGEPYLAERQCSDGVWVLKQQQTGRLLERSTEQLFDALTSGTLTFRTNKMGSIARPIRKESEARKQLPTDIKTADSKRAKIRLAYVRATIGVPSTQAAIERAIDEVWLSLKAPESKKPGWISVYRWARAYSEAGQAPAVLVAAHTDKGNRTERHSQDVIEICDEAVDTVYMTLERPGVQHVLDIARAQTRKANLLRPKSGQLLLPTRRLVQRFIDDIPEYDRHVARYGRESARKKFRTVRGHRMTQAPLQRAEMDHTRMDLFAVDDVHGLPLGRPWLTILIDDFSRCVLGFCLSFEPPSRATVARCLRHAFMPKTGLRAEYPDMKNNWIAFGVVAELVMDGGTEFHSEDLENICFELDIEQHFSPRKTPWFKGKVERFQGTMNRGVTVETPGKTFTGILERDDYDPKKHAVVTMSALRHLIHRWIVDVYHQKPHSALGCSPAQMWANNIRIEDIPLMSDPLRFDAILGGTDTRMLTHKGIEFAGLLYNSSDLADIRRSLGDRLEVAIRIDRSDLGSVIVLHPERGTPYRVPCLRLDYAKGLTEWQHNICKRYARDVNRAGADVDAWLDSLLEISEIVSREMKLGKRKGTTRERMARWSEGKQGTVATDVDPKPVQLPPKKAAALPDAGAVAAADSTSDAPPQSAPIKKPKKTAPAAVATPAATPAAAPAPSLGVPPVVRKRITPIFEEREPLYSADVATTQGGPSHV